VYSVGVLMMAQTAVFFLFTLLGECVVFMGNHSVHRSCDEDSSRKAFRCPHRKTCQRHLSLHSEVSFDV
jgi:hypothetical protein